MSSNSPPRLALQRVVGPDPERRDGLAVVVAVHVARPARAPTKNQVS